MFILEHLTNFLANDLVCAQLIESSSFQMGNGRLETLALFKVMLEILLTLLHRLITASIGDLGGIGHRQADV